MIANCGALHLDWRETSMSAYFEALEAHNEAHDPKAGASQPASPEFRAQMRRIFDAEKQARS